MSAPQKLDSFWKILLVNVTIKRLTFRSTDAILQEKRLPAPTDNPGLFSAGACKARLLIQGGFAQDNGSANAHHMA